MVILLTCVGIGVGGFAALYALRQWIKGPRFRERVSGEGRVAVVTGANTGIGKQLTRELVQRGVRVYMLCRSAERGRSARQELVTRYGCNPLQMVVMEADLASFASIRAFADEFQKLEPHLDILVNNAGVCFLPRFEKTEDNWERTWQVNFLGHFLLTELLRPALEASAVGARVVNVSSAAQGWPGAGTRPPDAEIVNDPANFSRWKADTYARSKLAQVMHAVALTKRLRDENPSTKVCVNACHPGRVRTEICRLLPGARFICTVFAPILWFFSKTPNDGAQTPLFLALSTKVDGVSGKYFCEFNQRPEQMNPLAQSPELCEQLYNESLEACGLVGEAAVVK